MLNMRKCTGKCGEVKDVIHFYRIKRGTQSQCKLCKHKIVADWKRADRRKKREAKVREGWKLMNERIEREQNGN